MPGIRQAFKRSILDRLPVELFSIIFSFYTSDLHRGTSPFTLGAVCRGWRDIAWSTPDVWMNFNATFSKVIPLDETRLQLAQDFLGRSGRLPLTISLSVLINFSDQNRDPRLELYCRLVDVILKHSSQWYDLYLSIPPPLFGHLCRYLIDAPSNLNLLYLNVFAYQYPQNLSHPNPLRLRPKIVDFTELYDSRPLELGWDRVTSCSMHCLALGQVFQVLQHGNNLLECDFDWVNLWHETESFIDPPGHITHHSLQQLHIRFSPRSETLGPQFFNNITLPGLKHLSVQTHSGSLVQFIARSSCKLQTLRLIGTQDRDGDLLNLAQLLPSLEELYIALPYFDGRQGLPKSFKTALAPHVPSTVPSTDVLLLPCLRLFYWDVKGIDWNLIRNLIVPHSSVDKRIRRPLESITIRYRVQRSARYSASIPEDIAAQLRPFRDQIALKVVVLDR